MIADVAVRVQSFDELFRANYGPLVRSLALACGPERAADAVQDAFVQANRRWAEVSTMDRPAAWVRRVALNRLIDEQRRDRRREQLLVRLAPAAVDRELDPIDVDLAEAVAALPLKQRLAVVLFYLLDLPVDEVAELLGASPGTIKSNLHDARRRLAEHLGDPHA